MEIIRSRALANNIGFMGFALVTPHGDPLTYRQPSESDVYWQVYSLITYGAKGVWYYNYRNDFDDHNEGLVTNADGTATDLYYVVQAVNSELINIGSVLMQLQSKGAYHTGSPVPNGTTQYTNGSIAVLSDVTGDNFLIGEFTNNDLSNDDTYLMFMNKRHSPTTTPSQESAQVSFTLSLTSLNVYKYDPSTGSEQVLSGSGGTYNLNIDGGKGVLLRISEN
jgi:hypothetical protein